MAMEERVLCFKRKLLEDLGVFQGLSLEVEKYLPVVTAASSLTYLNRSDAEQDKRYKQLIPYILLISDGRILRYRRGKGGQVHFGVVHVMQVTSENVAGRRSGIVAPEFIPIADAMRDVAGYESWSRFCLENMALLLSRAAASGVMVSERVLS